ncbi:MAG: hypothetical protein V7637_3605, partial [Mycobacteriales bacterium]
MRRSGRAKSRRRGVAVGVAVLAVGLTGPGVPALAGPRSPAAVPTGADVTYAHDAAGRVTAAFDGTGDGARIGYDAVGNVTGVTPLPAATLVVAQVSPPAAPVGAAVDVFGTHLGTDPAAVTVAFGSASAHPSAIVGNKASVTVPSGAASGTVTVTAGGQSATWPGFTVITRPAPTITGLSAVVADPGGTVTVTGTGFQPAATDNRVDMAGTRVPVRSATATSLVLDLPAVRPFGHVRLATPDGTVSSAADLFVPPAPYLAADVSPPVRVDPAHPGTISVGAQKIGLAVFDVPAGARAAVTLAGSGFGSYAGKIWGPEFRVVAGQDSLFGSQQFVLDPRPVGTTYEVEIDPASTLAGSATVSLQTGVDQTATVTVNGAPVTLTTTVPLTQAAFRFRGEAGQRVLARIATTTTPSVGADAWLVSPTGDRIETRTSLLTDDVLNGVTLNTSGTYTIMVATRSTGTLSATVGVATAAANPVATTTIDGTPGSLTFSAAGQLGRVTFDGTAGQRIWVRYHTTFVVTFSPGTHYSLLGPDGSTVQPEDLSTGADDTFGVVITLPSTGTYTVDVDPAGSETGTSSVGVTTVPATPATITAAVDGQPHSANVAYGQDAVATFSGTAGQRVSITIDSAWTSGGCDTNWTLTGPGTTGRVASDSCSRFMDTVALPVTGSYQLAMDLNGRNTGAITVRAFLVPDDATATATVGGAAVTATTTVPGQNAAVTFTTALANQRVFITCSISPARNDIVSYRLLDPAGTVLTTANPSCTPGVVTDTRALGAAGPYRVAIDPNQFNPLTAAFTIQVFAVPDDAAATATVGGPAVTVATPAVGQNATITFTTTTSQVVTAKVTATTYGFCRATVRLFAAGATTPIWTESCPAAGSTDTVTLPAGSYTINVDPTQTDTGSITYQLSVGTAAAGTGQVPRSHRATRSAPRGTRPSTSDGGQPARPAQFAKPAVSRPLPAYYGPTVDSRNGVLTGLIRRTDGKPLAGVTLRIDGRSVRTDATGRFRLTGLPQGTRVLRIDGRTASRGAERYGVFSVQMQLRRGVNALPYTPYLPVLDTAHEIPIDSPTRREVVLTNPRIPGLEVHVPAGVTITDADGRPVRRLGITPIPVSRTPIPMPRGVQVPVYYTVQPAGGSLHGGAARLVYPNYLHQRPGTPANFWHYEKGGDGWEVYGGGRVDGYGRQVQPLAGTKLYDFDGAMINVDGWLDDLLKPLKEATGKDGDPVDLGTGLFGMSQTDLTVNDVLPLALTRAYNSGSGRTRAIGIGMHHDYDLYLSSDGGSEADLNLADGSQIHYVRTSPGDSFEDLIMTAAPAPTDFAGSTLAWNGNGWDLVMTDGTTLVFGDLGPLQSIHDRYGNETTIVRSHVNFLGSPVGDVQAVRSTNGSWFSFTYGKTAPDGRSLLTRVDDSAGRHVSYDYDAAGRLTTVTDPAGGITRYGYDTADRLTTITDPRNVQYLTNEYDTDGRVHRQTVDGGTYVFDYTVVGGKVTQTQVTDPLGHIRRVSDDADGYLVSDARAVGTPAARALQVTRDPTSHIPTDFVDPLGHTVHSSYDPVGRPLSSTHAVGTMSALSSSATFDAPFHQPDTVTDAAGKVSHLSYDPDGNLTGAADPLSHGGSATYRPDGQPDTVTTPAGETSRFGYDAGQMTSVTDPAGRQTTVFRDAANRPSVVTGPNGLRSTTRYDALNLVRQTTDAAGAVTSYDYDENGDLKTIIDPRTHSTTFDYDDFGRLLTRTDPLGHADTYTYDVLGNVLTHTDRRGLVTEYGTDEAGRLTFVGYGRTGTAAPFSYDSTVTYGWDVGDRLMTVTDSAPGAGTITYAYDDLDRVTSRTDARGTITYGYDTAGRLARTSVSGQPDVTYGYDDASRLTSITKGTQTVTYTLDSAGRVTLAALPGGVSVSTGYDAAGQLSTLTYQRGTTVLGGLTYRYNSAGQRDGISGSWARLALPAPESGAVYDDANRLTAVNGRTLTYDDAGDLTVDGASTYGWDVRGELTGVTDTSGTATMGYGADGQLARVTRGGVDTLFRYDGGDLVTQQAGTATTSYLPNPAGDGVLTRTDAAGTQTFLTDAQDSTLALTDAAGQIVASYTYDPFGQAASDLSSDPNAIRYTGRPSSPDVPGGLQYNNARFYSPGLHRFVSQDPLGEAAGPNSYAYAGGDPVDRADPSGLIAPEVIGCAVGALIRDIGGSLWGTKHTLGDYAKGALLGCLDGAMIGDAAGELGSARVLTREAEDGAAEAGAAERAAGERGGGGSGDESGIPRSSDRPCNCFPAGTTVDTPDGPKRIEDVKVGDKVIAHDLTTGHDQVREVTGLFQKRADDLLTITTDGQQFQVTPQHAFWVPDRGWTISGTLRPGDHLLQRNGRILTITAITHT